MNRPGLILPTGAPRLWRRRPLSGILGDVRALPSHHWLPLWRWLDERVLLDGWSAPRWLAQSGPNAGALGVLYGTHCDEAEDCDVPPGARRLIAALFAQDNPFVFVKPPWAPDLDLPGAVDANA